MQLPCPEAPGRNGWQYLWRPGMARNRASLLSWSGQTALRSSQVGKAKEYPESRQKSQPPIPVPPGSQRRALVGLELAVYADLRSRPAQLWLGRQLPPRRVVLLLPNRRSQRFHLFPCCFHPFGATFHHFVHPLLRFFSEIFYKIAGIIVAFLEITTHLFAGLGSEQKRNEGARSQANQQKCDRGPSRTLVGFFIFANTHDGTSFVYLLDATGGIRVESKL